MPAEPLIGWDVGGAHLKAARLGADGRVEAVVQVACPLWQGLAHLESAVASVLGSLGTAPRHAVTMTGEMTDLFPGRREGVLALAGTMERLLPGCAVGYFAGRDGLVSLAQVEEHAARIASANWIASAALVAMKLPAALLVDVGSTTTDLVVVAGGQVRSAAADDFGRLVSGELVYTGVVRTPLMAVADAVRIGKVSVPLMAEYFATTADVYRITGELPEGADLHPAADGGPKTPTASARRLARMIGCDLESAPWGEWQALAAEFRALQLAGIEGAAVRQLGRMELPPAAPLVAAGVGRFLAPDLARSLGHPLLDFADLLPDGGAPRDRVADCAPAVAVALLAFSRPGPAPAAPGPPPG